MKVLIVNKFLYPNGGSETYIFEIGKQLQKMGHEVQYFGMEHEGRIVGNHAESYTANMDFHTGKLQKLLYPFKIIYSIEARKKIKLVLEDFNPDVIHLNNFTYQITPAILYEIKQYEKKSKNRIKIVLTAHDPQLVCPNHLLINGQSKTGCELCLNGKFRYCTRDNCIHGSKVKSLLGTIESRLYRTLHTYRLIDAVICPSEFIKNELDHNPDLKGKTVVLRNFISIQSPSDNIENQKQPYVLYLGRYSEEKGIKTLIKAARELPEIPFVFAGNGSYEDQVNEIVNITNKGFVSGVELSNLIANAKFSLIASECYENCPFTVMESQMLGTPVIGANIGGIPELIREGQNGLLFESGNVEDLKEKIKELWFNESEQMMFSNNCNKIQYDDIVQYIKKLLQLYEL